MKENITTSLIVLLNLLVLMVHGKAHLQLQVKAHAWQNMFIAVIIFLVPMLATALVWTRLKRVGIALLALSMTGSWVFGVTHHLLVHGSDNILAPHHGQWALPFAVTAIGLALIEAGTVIWCILVLRNSERKADER